MGRSKAAHEFLVLHYFGLDSAKHWEALVSNLLPAVRLPGASARPATALEMFRATHIQPSHRRVPHVLWTDSMTLIWNLLMGGRMGRHTGSPNTLVLDQRVELRGFSAGSFAGLSTLQSIFCTTSRIVHVCGSPANANWTCSRFAIHMFAPRSLPIKNTLELNMESGAVARGPASQVECQELRKGLTRLPADTPRTPGPKSVDFQQFCDRLRTDLPGDSHGRGSFDTSARFVAGDPGARFGDSAPLEYEVTGEIGHPHWELIFEYILRQCGYLVDFHTVYVMVDNRELANHKRRDPSLPHWPAAARWWHSRLKLIGPHKELDAGYPESPK